jgi:hypothetical protein
MADSLLQSALPIPALPSPFVIRVVRGTVAVRGVQPLLARFAAACGQPEAAQDLTYFLSKPGILQRTPVLIFLYRRNQTAQQAMGLEGLAGTLLLYEYKFAGIGTRLLTSNDRAGCTTLIALPELRARIVSFATERLLKESAHLILLSFRDSPQGTPCADLLPENPTRLRWAVRTRRVPDYLPLKATLDETLTEFGQRMRGNIQYYRRRAEEELRCCFEPALTISRSELLALNRRAVAPRSRRMMVWRLRALQSLDRPLLMGLRDGEGKLLSVLGGRRVGASSEILWQLDSGGHPNLGLDLVMRSYFLEHEIAHGSKRFSIEGGCDSSIRQGFTSCDLTDVALLRRSCRARITRWLARHLVREDNELAKMLTRDGVRWQAAGGSSALLQHETRQHV